MWRSICRVGQNRIYTPCKTVPAKYTVYTPYMPINVWFWPTLSIKIGFFTVHAGRALLHAAFPRARTLPTTNTRKRTSSWLRTAGGNGVFIKGLLIRHEFEFDDTLASPGVISKVGLRICSFLAYLRPVCQMT